MQTVVISEKQCSKQELTEIAHLKFACLWWRAGMVLPQEDDGGDRVGFGAATDSFLATLLHIKESTTQLRFDRGW